MNSGFGLSNTSIRKDKGHLVIDCDEVLVRISPKWVHLMHTKDNFDYFSKFFRLSETFNLGRDYEKILMRPVFYLDQWLLRSDALSTHGIDTLNEARQEFFNLYNGDYYSDLPPTNFANALSIIGRNSAVEKISVVTRTARNRPELDDSKIRFIKNLFNGINHKVDIFMVQGSEDKKSDVISKLGNNIGFIYEDEISNVEDIIESCDNLQDSTIMIPQYGYNGNLGQKHYTMATKKGIRIQHYYDM